VKRAILLRFHKSPFVCRSRVGLLRALNPDVPVYGVCDDGRLLMRLFAKSLVGLDSLYASRADARWNWQHGDLVVAEWYRRAGAALAFDVLHLVEWDLLLAEPLSSIYASVPESSVGLTALTPISDLEQEWTWLRREENRRDWEALLAYARDDWGYDDTPYGCVGPGAVFPRAFLEAYAGIDPPSLCNDELRLPLFAQILGFPLADTRLRGPWRGEREHDFFHFRGAEIELETIRAELAKPDGARAFHPVRSRVEPDQLSA
jgi:hypothetical protein